VEVDVVDAGPAETPVARGANVRGTAVEPAQRAVLRVANDAALGGERHLRAPPANGPPDELLVGVRPVHVGGVEERDAEIERAVDRRNRLGLVGRAVELAHARAEAAGSTSGAVSPPAWRSTGSATGCATPKGSW